MITLVDFIKQQKQINEAFIYDGGEELCRYVCKVIEDNPTEDFIVINEKDLKGIKNVFFKHLLLYIDDPADKEKEIKEAIDKAKYHYNRVKHKERVKYYEDSLLSWNIEEKRFNYIEISIKTIEGNRKLEWGDLSHEINHAWDDYQEKLKDPSRGLMSDVNIEDYDIAVNMYEHPGSNYDQIIGLIEYMSTAPEKKSFSVQAMAKLKDNIDKYSNFRDALEWQLKNNETFAGYVTIQKSLDGITSSKKLAELLCARCRKKFQKYKNLSDNEIIDKLKNKLLDFYNALIEDINTILDKYGKKTTL